MRTTTMAILVGVLCAGGAFAQSSVLTQRFVAPIPLAEHEKGKEIVSEALRTTALANVQWTFLNETYSNHVYAKDPFGNKYKVSCLSFRALSGFTFKMPEPSFTLTSSGLTVTQRISKIEQNGLKFKFQIGPCIEHSASFGFKLDDVKVTWKAKPMISFQDGGCKLVFQSGGDDLKFTIGDLNIYNSPNDLDKLVKDAIREALNQTLNTGFDAPIRRELKKQVVSVCGSVKKK